MFNNRNNDLIEELKSQRRVALLDFKQVNLVKNERLAEYFFCKFQEGKDVPFNMLKNIPVGEALLLPVVFGGAIVTTKQEEIQQGQLEYCTKWTSGSTLTMHYHSDCNEVIKVIKGKIKIFIQGSTHIIKAGESIEVGYGIIHQITALHESELNITFIKIL